MDSNSGINYTKMRLKSTYLELKDQHEELCKKYDKLVREKEQHFEAELHIALLEGLDLAIDAVKEDYVSMGKIASIRLKCIAAHKKLITKKE